MCGAWDASCIQRSVESRECSDYDKLIDQLGGWSTQTVGSKYGDGFTFYDLRNDGVTGFF